MGYSGYTGGSLNNNYARSNMTVRNSNSSNEHFYGLTAEDGASTTAYNTQTFWTTAGNWYNNTAWNFTTIWQWNSTTNLPILRNMPGNPAQNHTVQ